jgi:hypothetical protein
MKCSKCGEPIERVYSPKIKNRGLVCFDCKMKRTRAAALRVSIIRADIRKIVREKKAIGGKIFAKVPSEQ